MTIERIPFPRAAYRTPLPVVRGRAARSLRSDGRVKLICEALIAHPSDTATAGEWAKRLKVTTKTVHRLFLKETGMTFVQWREQARLLFALRRANQSAFTAMFRRHFGKPPSEFYSS